MKKVYFKILPTGRWVASLLLVFTVSLEAFAQESIYEKIEASLQRGETFESIDLMDEKGLQKITDLSSLFVSEGVSLSEANMLYPSKSAVKKYLSQREEHISVTMPGEQGEEIEILLYQQSPLSQDASIETDEGKIIDISGDFAFYRGAVKGHHGSLASLTLSEGEMRMNVTYGSINYVLGKLDGREDGAHVWYRADQVPYPEPFDCTLIDDHDGMDEKLPHSTELEGAPKSDQCVRVRVEIDNGLVGSLGGEASAIAYTVGLFNEVTTMFDNDGIDLVVSEVFAWVGSSPYSGGLGNRLSQMSNNSPNADLTKLITDVGGGGIAYLSGLCSSTFGVSVSSIFGFYNTVPSYSWDVFVCAHELGHNLSSPHTHACAWNGNNTPIDGCGIQIGQPEGNCGTAPIPQGGGTIMSYCHQLSVGINFNAGFGPQPSTRMINYVNSRWCLGNNCVPFGGQQCDDEELTLEIVLDQYPGETTWEITDESDQVVASGGNYSGNPSGTLITENICLPEACYTFTIFDSFGDGICCAYGEGSYTLSDSDGIVLASGGEFGSSESTNFCVGDVEGPPPCQTPYPAVQNLSAFVQPNGVFLSWDPILGSLGCQIQGGLASTSSLTLVQVIESELSNFFIPPGQLPVNGTYRVRVRCGCSLNPPVAGPWTSYVFFNWGTANSMEPPADITFAESAMSFDLYPNPSNGQVQVQLNSPTEGDVRFTLYDLLGKVVFAERQAAMAGDQHLRFDFGGISEGVYLLQAEHESGDQHQLRVVIKR